MVKGRLVLATGTMAALAFLLCTRGRIETESDDKAEARIEVARAAVNPGILTQIDAMPVVVNLGEWRNLGPREYGGKVFSVAVDPVDEKVVFAAYGFGGGLWRTRDGGVSWACVLDRFRNPVVSAVAVSPANRQVIYAGLGSHYDVHDRDRGVLRSVDGGDIWKAIGPTGAEVWEIVSHPTDANTVFVAAADGIYKTTNVGGTWVKLLSYAAQSDWSHAPDLKLHPGNPNILLVAQYSLGLVRSEDGGATWRKADSGMDQSNPVSIIAWSISEPDVVYVERTPKSSIPSSATAEAMLTYRSSDAGKTWVQTATINAFHQGRYDMAMAVDPLDAAHVLIANSKMSESRDGLRSVMAVSEPAHDDFLSLVFAPTAPLTVYAGTDAGLWKSDDGGQHWRRCDQGVETNQSGGFAVDDSGRIYLSAADYTLGITFAPGSSPRTLGGGYEWIAFYVNPLNPTWLFGAGSSALSRGDLRTLQWKTIDPDRNDSRALKAPVAFDPSDEKTVYFGNRRLWRSKDNGDTWTAINIPNAPTASIVRIAVAPSEPNRIYVAWTTQIFRSDNGGQTWAVQPGPLRGSSAIATLAIDPGDPSHIFIGASEGVFESFNGGAQLVSVNSNLPAVAVHDILIDSRQSGRIFLGTDVGVMVTQDGARTWSRLGREMPVLPIYDLHLKGALYASTPQGIWAMALDGAHGCQAGFETAPASYFAPENGGDQVVSITAAASCMWTIADLPDWIQVSAFEQNSGSGVLRLTVAGNSGDQREASIQLANDKRFLVRQFASGTNRATDGATVAIVHTESGNCLQAFSTGGQATRQCVSDASQQYRLTAAENGLFSIQTSDGRCWSVSGRSAAVGTTIGAGACTLLSNQRFTIQQITESTWQFIPENSGLCAEVFPNAFIQNVCDSSRSSQAFTIVTH